MKVTYDAKSFLLNDRRIWLVSGEIHYFRHPYEEWKEVLLRAQRAGLNTISTYVPWNFHEMSEGVFDFTDDKDLGRYIDLIGEMGMYAMLRPGPYICSEWDGGGIPAWLCAKPVRRFREDDPVYMAAVENWFDRLIPIISERQVTKGGTVLTVQNENEYPGGWDDSMRRYIRKLNAMFQKHGIDVPILACNVHGDSETAVRINDSTDPKDQVLDPGMILTYNHHLVVEPVRDLQSRQPGAPLITTEFWCGAPVYWGQPVGPWPDPFRLAQAAYEYTSLGTQVNYYMFDGGTNFGFWGGNNIATSYASDYPVGEGGWLTGKYYAIRPANLFAWQFGGLLADSEERKDKADFRVPEGVRLVVRECGGGQGAIAFVSAADERKEIWLQLQDGKRIAVHWGQVSASALPVGLRVSDDTTIDYSNLTLLARDQASKLLILYGPAGTDGVISVNGREINVSVIRRKVAYMELEGIRLLITDEEMAQRCWFAEGQILLGPDYVVENSVDGSLGIKVSDATPDVVLLDADAKPQRMPFRHQTQEFTLPELSAWGQVRCPEPGSLDPAGGWTRLEQPCSHEDLGIVQGYVWYSAELECTQDGIETLLLTHTPNRVSVFVNGTYCGVHAEGRRIRMRDEYGHPADWAFEEITVRVHKGTNRFVFLSDDLGHNYDVPVPIGIQGPVFVGSRRVEIGEIRELPPMPVSEDALHFLYSRYYREAAPLPAVEFDYRLEEDQEVYILMHGVHAWVTVNGEDVQPMSYPESPWTMFPQIKRWLTWRLPEQASGCMNRIRIHYAENVQGSVQENMVFYTVPKSGELKNWQWKRWDTTADFSASESVGGAEAEREKQLVLLPSGHRVLRKSRTLAPVYWQTRFPLPDGDRPVFLQIGELQKGHIVLNGRLAGRFWRSGGTQDRYYLPRSWMCEDNELVIFEEIGCVPQNTSLVYGDGGQWTSTFLPPASADFSSSDYAADIALSIKLDGI